MSTTTSPAATPTLVPGRWTVDTSHSSVECTVRHLMVSKVRGRFTQFAGAVQITPQPLDSSIELTVEMASVDTHDEGRDGHLRTNDFFDVEHFPTMGFRSTALHPDGDGYRVVGELTIKDVTRAVEVPMEVNGVSTDPWGGTRAGFSASFEINRKDYGVAFNAPIAGGGVLVGEKVRIDLEIQVVLATD